MIRRLVWRFQLVGRIHDARLLFQCLSEDERALYMLEQYTWTTTGVPPGSKAVAA